MARAPTIESLSPGRLLARSLERGAARSSLRWLALPWMALANPVRPLVPASGTRVIGVGGATLGGSGKTTLVGELARRLAGAGERVAVVAGAHGARTPPRASRVLPEHDAHQMGDEAVLLARTLAPHGVSVFAGRSRALALQAAEASGARLIVVDGLLQSRPEPLALSLLALEGSKPWGAGICPPLGDLRAAPARLGRAADVVLVREPSYGSREPCHGGAALFGKPLLRWWSGLVGARAPSGAFVSLGELSAWRVGLVLSLARPERVLRELEEHAIRPVYARLCGDHAAPRLSGPELRRAAELDAWLTTPKCKTKLGDELAGAPVLVLEQAVELPLLLLEMCRGVAAPA